MINERELRVGNLIHREDILNGHIRTESILEITNFRVMCSGPFRVALSLDDITPIPLTKEWLIRFGFELVGINLYELNGFYVLVKGNEFRFTPYGCLLDTNPDFESFNKVEFVHELQNIYYWNNNKTELELK